MYARLKDSWLLFPLALERDRYASSLPEGLHGTRKKALGSAYDAQYEVRNVMQHTLKHGPQEMLCKCSPVYVRGDEHSTRHFRIKFVPIHTCNTEPATSFKRGKRDESAKEDEGETDEDEIQHRYG